MQNQTADQPQDAIVIAVSHYQPKDLAVWFNSLKATSFTGRVFAIAYEVSEDLVHYLEAQGATVFTFEHDAAKGKYSYSQLAEELEDHMDDGKLRVDSRWTWLRRILRFKDKIHDRRFFHASQLLARHCAQTGESYRFLAFSDARDVAFQANPFDWLETALPADKDIAVAVEGIDHRDAWNRRMMIKAFGKHALARVENQPVVCCGYFAGRFQPMLELMLANYYVDQSKRIGDQVAMNQLLSFDAWRRRTLITDWTTPWTLHACTTLLPSESEGFYADPETLPEVHDGVVMTRSGLRFAVVHHTDRHPDLQAHLNAAFSMQKADA
ncbi:hypothetical protein [Roseibium sp.]|uniref:hypothetical protein n=1 Tax=Roseibium sp. TaxID=1936156 RepID=UPI003A977F9C